MDVTGAGGADAGLLAIKARGTLEVEGTLKGWALAGPAGADPVGGRFEADLQYPRR